MKNKTTQSKSKPSGRPKNPELSKLETSLGVTRRRAAQLLKQAAESDPGAGRDYLKLRCKRMEQSIEKSEIELAKLRAGDEEKISLREVGKGLEMFLYLTRVFGRRAAGEVANRAAGLSTAQLRDDLLQFADLGHYAGTGAALLNVSAPFAQIFDDILAAGDWRYQRGPGLKQRCVEIAQITMNDES